MTNLQSSKVVVFFFSGRGGFVNFLDLVKQQCDISSLNKSSIKILFGVYGSQS